MRIALGSTVLLSLALAAGAVAQEEPRIERWDGFVPSFEPTIALGDEEEDSPPGDAWVGVCVRDARTFKPIEGAVWSRSPEWLDASRRRQDSILAVATTDADGLAWMESRAEVWADDCHWVVTAPGYAPHHHYGYHPESVVFLERGGTVSGRLLDPLGRPVAGGLVEYLVGCSHSTAAVTAVTNEDGAFELHDVEPDGGMYWYQGRGIESGLYGRPHCVGDALGPVDTNVGVTIRGQVVDLFGRPLTDVGVRQAYDSRGMATVTNADGRFEVRGVTDHYLRFTHPADLSLTDGDLIVDSLSDRVPVRIVLAPAGVVRPEVPLGTVTVEGRDPDGVLQWTDVELHELDRGVAEYWETAAGDGADVLDLDQGRWRVFPGRSSGTAWTFEPVDVTIGGEPEFVRVALLPRSVVQVTGEWPDDADVMVATEHWNEYLPEDPDDEGADSLYLDADEPAAVVVLPDGGPSFHFAFGPAQDGRRTAHVELPAPHLVHFPADTEDWELIRDGQVVAHSVSDEGVARTWAVGEVEARWSWTSSEDRSGAARVVLPAEPGNEIRIEDVRSFYHSVTVTWMGGRGDSLEILDTESAGAGDRLAYWEEGCQVVRLHLPDKPRRPEFEVFRRGAALRLRVVDEAGHARSARVLLDGEIHHVDDGTLALRGLAGGRHRLLVGHVDRPGGGAAVEFDVAEGGTAEVTVELREE